MTTPIKWGTEFLVNTTTSSAQFDPQVTALAGGRFVVTWTDSSLTGGDTSNAAVRGQVLNADGSKLGMEFLVNTTTAGFQTSPAVTAVSDGGFVVAWEALGGVAGDTSSSAIAAQRYGANGVRVGGEFLVNTTTADSQLMPAVSALADGKLVAAWTDYSGVGDTAPPAIRAQMFDALGAKFGVELLVNSTTPGVQMSPDIATLTDGRFVVAWVDESMTGGDASASAIRARLFNAVGIPFGPDFVVNTTAQDAQRAPNVTALTAGRFLVTWEDYSKTGSDTSGAAVRGQVFNSDGIPSGSEFLVNTTTLNIQALPVAAGLPNGGFVIAWHHLINALESEVRAQVFDGNGAKSADEFIVNTENAGHQNAPTIAVLADGRFVIAMQDGSQQLGDQSSNGIAAQIFDPREGPVQLRGTALDDQLVGTRFADHIGGYNGSDWLQGGDGDDTLWGDLGADVLDGGAGVDAVRYDESPVGVYVYVDGAGHFGHAADDTLRRIENLRGSAYSDVLAGDDNNNALSGNDGGDTLYGLGGDDTLQGDAGDDAMVGGAGNDTYLVTDGGDMLYENAGEGTDTVIATITYDLRDNVENLVLSAEVGGAINGTGNALANRIIGNASANRLDGGGGNDLLDGDAGDDTALFSQNFNDYTVMDFGNRIVVSGPDGIDTLSSIEHLQFIDVTITPVNDGNPLFDTLYYLSRNADVFHAGMNALDHYNAFGRHEGRDPNAFFDTSGYLAVNKDVAAGVEPLAHYHNSGWQQGRDPSAWFDTTLYLLRNPDVAAAGIDPLEHYLAAGFAEGRVAHKAVGSSIVGGFDAQYYLFHNPDVAAAAVDPLFHFNAVGWKEGRDPNAFFDTSHYLSRYADVAAAGINPLDHYEMIGWKEGRDPSGAFDTTRYLADNPDVAAANVNPLDHYLQSGIYEGRALVVV